jgi:2-oxoisovalerate dehydrogenase E1 component
MFEWLDAPVKRIAAADTFVAYAPELEDVILPQVESLQTAMSDLLGY